MREWWAPTVADATRLRQPGYQPYAVLTMCRALYTLAHGTIVSKPVAAHWALATLDARWGPLVTRALAGPTGNPADLPATQDLIACTVARWAAWERREDDENVKRNVEGVMRTA